MQSKKCLSPVVALAIAIAPAVTLATEYEKIQGTLFEVVRKDGKIQGYKTVPSTEYQQAQQLYQSQTGQAQSSETVDLNAARTQFQSGSQVTNQPTQIAPIAPTTAPTVSGGGAKAAKGTQVTQIISIGASVATAGLLVKPCGAVATSAWACPMLAMSLAQAASLFGSQGGAGRAASAISTGGTNPGYTGLDGTGTNPFNQNPYGPNGSGTNPNGLGDPTAAGAGGNNPNGLGGPTAASPELQQYLKEYQALSTGLAKAGYKLSADGKSVTGPNGKKTPTSAFSSPEAMQAAGFGMDDISAMNATMAGLDKKISDKLRAVQMSAEGSGGGGGGLGGGYGSGGGGGDGSGLGRGGFPWDKEGKGKGDGRGVAGMMKKLGDDNIGVAADNIFEMVQRRYKARDEANNFLKE